MSTKESVDMNTLAWYNKTIEKVGKIRRFTHYSEVDYSSILRNRGYGWDEPDGYSEVWTMERYAEFETYHLTINR